MIDPGVWALGIKLYFLMQATKPDLNYYVSITVKSKAFRIQQEQQSNERENEYD